MILNVPLSRVSPLVFLIHNARKARGEDLLQSVTFSASIWEFMIGTRAEWFLKIVIFSFRLYSNRSPSSWALAETPSCSAASARLTGAEAGRPAPNPEPLASKRPGLAATPPTTQGDIRARRTPP